MNTKIKNFIKWLRPGWKTPIVNFIALKVNTYISKIGPVNFLKATKNETIY